MKILHTADWHLGQTFYRYRRDDEHRAYFRQLLDRIEEHRVDALLVAGDIFDLRNPRPEALSLYYGFIEEVSRRAPGCRVYVLAGNHDSASRLAAPAPLLQHFNTRVIARLPAVSESVEDLLSDYGMPLYRGSEVAAYLVAVPFIGPGRLCGATDHGDAVVDLIRRLAETAGARYPGVPLVGMGHFFAADAVVSGDDERERIIGKLEQIPVKSFASMFTYFALGHLHRPQAVGSHTHIRYAGSPIGMSFSETNYRHGTTLVNLDAGGLQSTELLPFNVKARLLRLSLCGEEDLDGIRTLLAGHECEAEKFAPFVEVSIPSVEYAKYRVEEIHKAFEDMPFRLCRIVPRRTGIPGGASETDPAPADTGGFFNLPDPRELVHRIYFRRHGVALSDSMDRCLVEAVNLAQNEDTED